ncbi:serine/threonine-protein phosphatase 6 regulatory ankyrin repeat subunit B [Halyomorpha halys]|uniref:serine/threonine-protein phosphatase 6 regulatory ankyrin repeat subunit B n=1 Tax=Halyomorpha halys TaxID=286706 RepID=UPI0006D4DE05|nr:uncharacterized protein LOC106679370 [Halyomorpha halys]
MSEKEDIDRLLSEHMKKTKRKIQLALEWARECDSTGREYNSQQIAVLVFLFESANPNFSERICETLCPIDTAEKHSLAPWLKETFTFKKQEVYDSFKTWMKSESQLGFHIAYGMNCTYGIMQEAARNGGDDILKWLLSRNVEVDFMDCSNNTALHIAAAQGRLATVKYLLEQGASIFVVNSELRRPFDLALDSEHFDVCDILCPMAIENVITESAMLDIVRETNPSKLEYLMRINKWDSIWNALLAAIENGDIQIVNKLLLYCPNLYRVPLELNNTVLSKAIVNGKRCIVRKLLSAGFEMDSSLIDLAVANKIYKHQSRLV